MRQAITGFTLFEILVTVAIMSVLAAILAVGWPRVRERQALVLAHQQLQLLIRQAQETALNRKIPEQCRLATADDTPERKRCDDVGVAIKGNQAVLFSDTIGGDPENVDSVRHYEDAGDELLSTHSLSATLIPDSSAWRSFVFVADPPHVRLYDSDQPRPLRGQQSAAFTLRAGRAEQPFTLYPYGQIE